ncbi:Membrane protein YdfJ [Maioricimonas rarisocia]|uniref:Membrane protein YdfJ n=1 Tax=Maioricimonas rarisocia TaxID=2528026 RepID=A0A517Z9F8_9PLAN|nr:MMPL family transporter [Maioricimonas rarisocia]QDU39122.1 Membrane protein YdfJ [Maioricimonas rarisocia]
MLRGSSDHEESGLLPRLLHSVTRSVSRRPGGALWLVAIVTLISGGVAARFLEFKTSRADLIDPHAEFHQRWLNYTERFGDQTDIVVVVESESTDEIRRVLDELGSALEEEPEKFDRVLYRFDPGNLRQKALQYLTPEQLDTGLRRLAAYGPILDGHWNRAGVESYSRRLAEHLRSVVERDDSDESASTMAQAELLCQSLEAFSRPQPEFVSPWPLILDVEADAEAFEPRYQLNDDGTMGFLLTVPVDTSQDFSGTSAPIRRLRELIDEVQGRHPQVTIGMTGIPVLESDEMRRSQSDMMTASLVSFGGVGLLLLIGFRGFRHPCLALMMLAVGLIWSLGFTTLAVGHLNILSVSFAAILIGLGIDFAIHYLAKYLEVRHEGVELRPALTKTSATVGTGIVTAAVTTALAFLCAMFTHFLGVAELGVIAGGGILLCCAATFIVLPALVTLADRRIEPKRLPTPFQGNFLRRLVYRHPWKVTLMTLAAIVVVGAFGLEYRDGRIWSRVQYDANLLNLQADGVESVEIQKRIFEKSDGSLLYAVSLADSPAQARRLRQQFLALPTVGHVEELGSRLPFYPPEETKLLVQGYRARLSRLSSLPREFPQLDPQAVGLALEDLDRALERAGADTASARLDEFLDRLAALPLGEQIRLLANYQYAMLSALQGQFQALAAVADPTPVGLGDFAKPLQERFVSPAGDWQVRVYPKEQVWDEEPLAQFVADVRSVDPDVTGTPLQNYEAALQIRSSYCDAAIYALLVICLVLLIDGLDPGPLWVTLLVPLGVIAFAVASVHASEQSLDPLWLAALYVGLALAVAAVFDFTSVRNTFLTLLPPLGGGFLMFGTLGLLGLHLNPANLIVLPLILGIGVDDGVHVIHDFRLQRGRYRTSPCIINGITLTSLTSMIGFGSMIAASHQGLSSLGLVLVIGVGSCLFVSLVTLPAILTLVARSRRGDSEAEAFLEESPETDAPEILPLTKVPEERSSMTAAS